MPALRNWVLIGICIWLPLLNGCVYFNTFFNAQKAYNQAIRLREKRLDKNPEDTIAIASQERVKLERSITKCSKVLELYPDKLEYAPKALFLMGESYLVMGEFAKAVAKYEELQRYYPKASEIPLAEVHRAKGLFLEGFQLKAQTAVEEILKKNPTGIVLRETLLLAAKMQIEGHSKDVALGYYEKLLLEKGLERSVRAEASWQAARLAFDLEFWEKSRQFALAPEKDVFATRFQYRNEKLAIQCRFRQKRFSEGMSECKSLTKRKGYSPFKAELQLLLAQGYEGVGDWKMAAKLYHDVPELSPKSAIAAEAYYRLGEHWLTVANREDSARVYFDSAAAAGSTHPYGKLGGEKADALTRLAELRKSSPPDTTQPMSQDFMIAELFLFRLNQVDSALNRLNGIVESKKNDSAFLVRAAYARAFIQEEFQQDSTKSDSLYRYVLENFPKTEWAKQAEKNLGLKPSVETQEDKARALFLVAETQRFGGEDLSLKVIPAYRQVAALYPRSPFASKALFVVAWLLEDLAHRSPPVAGSLDSAKAQYLTLKAKYSGTPYAAIAIEKLAAAGVKETLATTTTNAVPEAKQDSSNMNRKNETQQVDKSQLSETLEIPPVESVSTDTSENVKRHKEVLEPNYDNVDQY